MRAFNGPGALPLSFGQLRGQRVDQEGDSAGGQAAMVADQYGPTRVVPQNRTSKHNLTPLCGLRGALRFKQHFSGRLVKFDVVMLGRLVACVACFRRCDMMNSKTTKSQPSSMKVS